MKINLIHILTGIIAILVIIIISLINKGNQPTGEVLYNQYCKDCHLEDGKGLGALIPPLASADWLENNQDRLACIIKYGMKEEIMVNGVVYNNEMTPFEDISDAQIMNIVNYINTAWNNNFGKKTIRDIQDQLSSCTGT